MCSNRLHLPLSQVATIRCRVILKGKAWAIQVVIAHSQQIKLIRITIKRILRTRGPRRLLVRVRAHLAAREINEKVTTTQWILIKLMNIKTIMHRVTIMERMEK